MQQLRSYLFYLTGIIFVLYLTTSLVQTVRKNYGLRQEVSALEQEIDLLKIQQEELRYRIEYYQTDAFKEKAARAKLGLQLPGEGVIILPSEGAGRTKVEPKPRPKSNWQQWHDFLFG